MWKGKFNFKHLFIFIGLFSPYLKTRKNTKTYQFKWLTIIQNVQVIQHCQECCFWASEPESLNECRSEILVNQGTNVLNFRWEKKTDLAEKQITNAPEKLIRIWKFNRQIPHFRTVVLEPRNPKPWTESGCSTLEEYREPLYMNTFRWKKNLWKESGPCWKADH
jgi:hypothetical protein